MNIQAVLFDLGNTLIEHAVPGGWKQFRVDRVRAMYPLACRLLDGLTSSREDFTTTVSSAIGGPNSRAREIEHSGWSWHFGGRLATGLRALGTEATGDQIVQLTEFFYVTIRESTLIYPETAETLRRLRELGVRMAVISNAPWDAPTYLLRGDAAKWEIDGFLEAFVGSGDVPWRKPNPCFMLAAAEALGVQPEACLVVGDRIKADIAGAEAAGMKSVWVNRNNKVLPDDGPQPDWTINDLREVVKIASLRR